MAATTHFKAAMAAQGSPHQVVPAAMLAKLAKLRAQTKAMRQLDIKNQVTPPDDPQERVAIFDALPPELRELFADECRRHDAMKGRRHDA